MSTLIKHLRSLNRKERFILLNEALGANTFRLENGFRDRLGGLIKTAVPPDAFVAMDYHLDWIQMAIYLLGNPPPPGVERFIPKRNLSEQFNENQEDVDLLVAFPGDATTHLVMIEAKAETGWDRGQLRSKATRLRRIFDRRRSGVGLTTPHFVLM